MKIVHNRKISHKNRWVCVQC